jgi:ubiquinone/menaquinone biosynthesis C-methylase UbiE
MVDAEKVQALAGRLFEAGLGAMDLLAIYMGDKLGYYRALQAASAKGMTSTRLARKSGTNERYAREWLEQQAATGLIDVSAPSEDGRIRAYALPEHAAEVFVNADSMTYFTPLSSLIVAAASRAPQVAQAYRTGGGVSWSEFGREMREAQAAFNRPMYLTLLAKQYLSSVKDINQKLRSGKPARVADIACGGGWSSIAIAQAYPNVQVDGYDLDGPSITLARKNARAAGVAGRVRFHKADASDGSLAGKYDLALILEALHDMSQPVDALRTARRLVGKTGAVVVMDEKVADKFEAPSNPVDRFMYGASIMVCLPDSMSYRPTAATGTVMRAKTVEKYARAAGFKSMDVLPIENDTFRFYRLRQ